MYDQPLFDDGFGQEAEVRVAPQHTQRVEMERANAKRAQSLRDIGRESAEAELRGMRLAPTLNEVAVRVRATITTKSEKWCEVAVELAVHAGEWWSLGNPFLVARQGDQHATARSLYAISLIKQVLAEEDVQVELGDGSLRLGAADVEEWSWWAHLRSRLSVAVQVRPDGSVRVVGLR